MMTQGIEIVRGTTNTLEISVVDGDGMAYAAVGDEKIIFGVKRKATDTEFIIVKTATLISVGLYLATLTPDDTKDLECGRYVYDVGLQSGQRYYNIIPYSPFDIVANVTQWGCAD